MSDILARLSAPFPPDAIDWRAGSTNAEKTRCMALAYVDARTVMDRLDDVCGAGGWACEYIPMHNGTTCCKIGVLIDGHWVWRSNGAEMIADSDKPEMREIAIKGAYSDAFKRAAVLWGVGRYLYGVKSPWVECEAKGRSIVIKPSELDKLQALLPSAVGRQASGSVTQLPKKDARAVYSRLSTLLKQCGSLEDLSAVWGEEAAAIRSLPDDWRKNLIQEKDDIKALLASRSGQAA